MDQSFNDLKFQLQQEMQREGMVENMKTQLRYKLLERLQFQQKKIPSSDKVSDQELLLHRVLASAVADYLKEAKLDYSLSVFLPETQFGQSLLNKDELKLLLKRDSLPNGQSVLQQLVADILLLRPREPLRSNAATQTYTGDAIVNLEQKLNQVDSLYKTRIENELLKPQLDIEERFQKMKKDYDQRFKAELSAEVARIKEFEAQNIRLEEADKYRSKMQEYREELEKNYQDKLNKLRERERDALEKSANKMKELETLNYNYRQKIIKEHEYIKLKEMEIEKQKFANEEQLKFQKAKLDVMERDLQKKLSEVNQSEDQIRKRYEAQINSAKVSAENEFYEEREKIKQKQKEMEKDLQRLDQLKHQNNNLLRENQQIVKENEEYVEQIRDLKRQKKSIEVEYETLKENIRALSDAQRRDQELCRKYETDIRLKEEELMLYKTTITHKDGMITDHKSLHQEAIRKLTKEIENYQQRVETQELLIRELQTKEHKQMFTVESALFKGNIADSLLLGYNAQDHKIRINQISRELDENRIKRREEIRRLQEEVIVPVNEQALKFEHAWDPENSSVNYSQSMNFTRKRQDERDRDPARIFQSGDDAQSQLFQSGLYQKKMPDTIVEENFQQS